jgi:hypothetical protein
MFDNVTPLRNAHVMSKDHEGSVVLTQDSSGHCSAFSSPSECTRNVIRRYFDTGELPAKGTICRADRVPWDGKGEKRRPAQRLPRDLDILSANVQQQSAPHADLQSYSLKSHQKPHDKHLYVVLQQGTQLSLACRIQPI